MRFEFVPKEEFDKHVEMIARELAMKHHQRRNHGCGPDASWAFACDNWRNFVGDAIEIVAVLEAMGEAEESAPWN